MAPHAESPGLERVSYLHDENGCGNGVNGVLPVLNGHNENASPVKPNILFIMADQMVAPMLKMHNPDSVIQTPNIDRLAESSVVFDSAYCNSPLCAPSRFCLVTGQLPSKIGAYDNASHLNADIPTFAHYLRREGYETVLSGKMHFIGPDQMHGYEKRLTSDIYPGDFGWSVNWDKPDERQEWFHNMSSVHQAGPCVRSNQLDFDEEVMYKSTQYLYDYVRQPADETRPFFLTVSLTHPHDPYATTQSLWEQYEGVQIPEPEVFINQEDQDPHSKRILKCIDSWDKPITSEALLRARRAYFGNCTYVDNQVGKLLRLLEDTHLSRNTIIVFSGDHGDMLGERGLWYKMSWFEYSARVPLIVNYPPRFAPRRVKESVSTMDLLPTFLDLVGVPLDPLLPIDGVSLYTALLGGKLKDEVVGEYMGEGTLAPVIMIRRGRWKYVYSSVDPPQLFDLQNDPLELQNLAESEELKPASVAASFAKEIEQRYDVQDLHRKVLQSQRQRQLCWNALKTGWFQAWDFEPEEKGSNKYIRSTIPLDELELRARYPPVDAIGRPLITSHPKGIAGAFGE